MAFEPRLSGKRAPLSARLSISETNTCHNETQYPRGMPFPPRLAKTHSDDIKPVPLETGAFNGKTVESWENKACTQPG